MNTKCRQLSEGNYRQHFKTTNWNVIEINFPLLFILLSHKYFFFTKLSSPNTLFSSLKTYFILSKWKRILNTFFIEHSKELIILFLNLKLLHLIWKPIRNFLLDFQVRELVLLNLLKYLWLFFFSE